MNWRTSFSNSARTSLVAGALAIVGILWAFSTPPAIAAEPAKDSAAPAPRTFELQLLGPDGKPVPKAEVGLRNRPSPKRKQVKVGEHVMANTNGSRIKTDDAGRIVVELTKVASYFTLDIQVPGYAPYYAQWRSSDNGEELPEKFVAELDAGWSVGGIVVDSEGKPVKGAEIHPSLRFKMRPGDEQELYVGNEVKSGDDGKWHFDCVPASMKSVSVSIKHPELMPQSMELARAEYGIELGKEPTAKIALKPGIVIAGHVTDEAGKPIEGARVFTREREAHTDKDGAYRLSGMGVGKVRLVVTAKGRAMDMQDLMIEPKMEPVDFVTKPGGKIRIRVLDKEDKPIAKSRVFFQTWRGQQINYFEFEKINQYANQDGVWEWDGAPLEQLEADICPPNGMQLPKQNITAREEEYVFHPLETLVISGTVTDAQTNEPIKSFRVIPGNRYGPGQLFWNRQDAYTAKDGKYKIRNNRAEGAQVVRVEADGYKPSESEDIKAGDENVALDFELERGADIEGVVLTPDGKPAAGAKLAMGIPGAQISIRNGDVGDSSTYAARVETDKAGKFHFPPQADAITLIVTHPSGFARISSGAEWKQDNIKLEPWARVEGTFRVGRKAMPHVAIEVRESDFEVFRQDGARIWSQHEATTDKDGHFVFERVLPGKGYISRRMIFMMNEGATEVTSARQVRFETKGGETKKIDLGGDGRKIVGRLVPPKGAEGQVNWRMARVNLQFALAQPSVPKPPAAVQNDPKKYEAWAKEWALSPEGKAFQGINEANNRARETAPYFHASADKDGNFTIDDVPPGSYQLSAYLEQAFGPGRAGRAMNNQVVVPAGEGEQEDAPIDVGEIPVGGA